MKQNRVTMLVAVVGLALVAGLLWYAFRADAPEKARQDVRIAVVLYGTSAERWGALDQGIAQACTELNIEKPVLTVRATPAADAADEQRERILREVANGAAGLLVAAADSAAMQPELETLAQTVPLVMMETGAGESLPCVTADNLQMGRDLAARLAEEGTPVALLPGELSRDSVAARQAGFLQQAKELGLAVDVVPDGGMLAHTLRSGKYGTVVALDNETLENAAATVGGAGVQLVGIGASDKVVHELDSGNVTEICYQNEFSIGYIAMMQLAEKMNLGGGDVHSPVEYRIVRRETMYDPDTERLLFPIIQ